jgi:hypothetical protein
MSENARKLALLEIGHSQAEQLLADLKVRWDRQDEATRDARDHIIGLHAEGARVRDSMRVQLGGKPIAEREAEAEAEQAGAEAKRTAADAWTP